MKLLILLAVLLFHTQQIRAQQYGPKFREHYREEKGESRSCRSSWTGLQRGLEWRSIRCLGRGDDVDLYVVRLDLSRWMLDAAIARRATSRSIARRHHASFAMNANFFGHRYETIGAVVRSGETVNDLHRSSWQSIFLIDREGKPRIILPERWKRSRDGARMAVQAGPRLVIAGHTNHSLRNNYAAARGGVCLRRNGDLLFFATPQKRKFHITEIAAVARRDPDDGGLGCHEAMLFDGGHSVNLYAQGDDDEVSVEGDPVPAHIFAVRRADRDGDQRK